MRRVGLLVWSTALLTAPVAAHAQSSAPSEPAWVWAAQTSSPRPVALASLSDGEATLQRECGRGEAGLRAVAATLVRRQLQGLPPVDAESLAASLRVAGEPHVWPRAWLISGRALDLDAARVKLRAWGGTFHEAGDRRCGVALAYGPDGTEAIAAVALDAEADLAPIPVLTHVGTWLAVDATVLVPSTGARVVVVGPGEAPRTVPSQRDGDRVRAQIVLDRPGAFTVQVVADVANGPRPVLEAELFADAAPWTHAPDSSVPGEAAHPAEAVDAPLLFALVGGLRSAERLPPLGPDARLDAVAAAHAQRMMRAKLVAHDLGAGDPSARIEAAGLHPRQAGENVAHAATVLLAHRALYASPSHRSNLLDRGFDRVGVGVAHDADGSVWVAEEFAGGSR